MSVSSVVRTIYHVLFYLPAQRAIRRMLANGLPAEFAPSLHYLSWPTIPVSDERILVPIDQLRLALKNRGDGPSTGFQSPEPQSADVNGTQRPKVGPLKAAPWEWLASNTSVNYYWGTFLYLCAKHHKAQTILELGSGAGMSACYLSASVPNGEFITVEGSAARAAVAEGNVHLINPRARVVNAMFDDALDEWLPKLSGRLDIVHIDGQHERVSTFHYFDRVKPHLRRGALVIFDDIHWSEDMRRTWDELGRSNGVSAAINVGRYGVCVWKGDNCESRIHDFSLYARDWRNEERPESAQLADV